MVIGKYPEQQIHTHNKNSRQEHNPFIENYKLTDKHMVNICNLQVSSCKGKELQHIDVPFMIIYNSVVMFIKGVEDEKVLVNLFSCLDGNNIVTCYDAFFDV